MRRGRVLPLALVALLAAGCSGVSKLDLFRGGRARWQRPDDVVRTLEIRPGDRVADVGAGEGYFVPFLADAVGASGRVYAVDVEEEITQELEERFAEDANVEVVLGRFEDPELPDAGIDLVLLVNSFHHIEDRPAYFTRVRGDLRPGGRVAVIEPDEELRGVLSLFLDEGHTSTTDGVVADMESAGYRHVESSDLLPVQIFEVFAPGPAPN